MGLVARLVIKQASWRSQNGADWKDEKEKAGDLGESSSCWKTSWLMREMV